MNQNMAACLLFPAILGVFYGCRNVAKFDKNYLHSIKIYFHSIKIFLCDKNIFSFDKILLFDKIYISIR